MTVEAFAESHGVDQRTVEDVIALFAFVVVDTADGPSIDRHTQDAICRVLGLS